MLDFRPWESGSAYMRVCDCICGIFSQTDETISLDSDSEEPSPEALARYLTMRRHTVGIAHTENDAAAAPTDAANYFTQHHHHHLYQPAAAGPFLHPAAMFTPAAAAVHGLPHVFMPQDLSVHCASEDESLPTNSSTIADSHLLRPPPIAGRTIIIIIIIIIINYYYYLKILKVPW